VIRTDRLDLHPLDRDDLRAVAAGDRRGRRWHDDFPREDDRAAARITLRHEDPVFGCYAVVERAAGTAVGTIGFFGPPGADGVVMVGYGLVEPARGQGYATEALRAIVDLALADPRVQWIEADPERDNEASHRVLEKAGFAVQREEGNARWYSIQR